MLFAKPRAGLAASRLIRCFAPAAFGVYLIHVQAVGWEIFIRDRFAWIAASPAWLVPIQVIGCAGGVFIGCLLIEKLRILLFGPLHFNERAKHLCSAMAGRILS